jgi:hypothetical protein
MAELVVATRHDGNPPFNLTIGLTTISLPDKDQTSLLYPANVAWQKPDAVVRGSTWPPRVSLFERNLLCVVGEASSDNRSPIRRLIDALTRFTVEKDIAALTLGFGRQQIMLHLWKTEQGINYTVTHHSHPQLPHG